ncbi:MAG: cadherin-like beta sandwich domain-containing protein, partial [Spirochaetes bacterium]|nr:cadherin-like beta sandwich domain-containing protein [Spirochaetota bacterium]
MKTFSPGEFEEEKEDFELKNNSALINLEITDVTINPSFSSEIKTYNATVVSSLTTVKVTPTAEYSRATIKVNGDTIKSGNQSDNIYLNVGISTINIEVTSYDKKNKSTYNVNITRANVLLSGLTSSSGSLSPAFNPQTFNYSMTVDYFIKTIAFTPFVSDNIVIIEINNLNVANNTQSDPVSLNYGTNQITVKVKYPQDVVATVYYISVTRNPI